MTNFVIKIKYRGTAYHGWQSQKNALSVQDVISSAILKVTGSGPLPRLEGCGRTDAGVHALDYTANFKSETRIPPQRMPYALNQQLPPDIRIFDCFEAPDDFHSRFSCIKKEYVYKILNTKIPDPFYSDLALFYPYKLNLDKMNEAAAGIKGRHDFAAFCAAGSFVKNTVREVYTCDVNEQSDGIVTVHVSADGFLYNMVRIIAGTLVYVSEGKTDAGAIARILRDGRRADAGITLPPHGLYLNKTYY